jgi:glycosyltransferase involved in cell wall biosynthesis
MRVVVVCGICVRHDAISHAVADQAAILRSLPIVEHVALIAQFIDRPLDADELVQISNPWDLLRHPTFIKADVVIFHWGIAYDLFDAVTVLREDPRLVVHFHNVTPIEYAGNDFTTVERSLRQVQLITTGDSRIWADSPYNAQTLTEWGIDSHRVVVLPFRIEPPRKPRRRVRSDEIGLLTVGRLVPAKGIDVLLDALQRVSSRTQHVVRLRIASNTSLSDLEFRQRMEDYVADTGLVGTVEFIDNASERELWSLYESADVVVSPSLHEGLCVPIIEGYLAGCRAIGTNAGNLPNVVVAPDPVAQAGDPESLATALEFMLDEIAAGHRSPPAGARALVEHFGHDAIERQLRTELVLVHDRVMAQSAG